jgi:hypothetical protein
MGTQAVEAVIGGFAKNNEEHLGRAIGLAAVISSLPGAQNITAERVHELVDQMMLEFVGAKSDTRAAARRMASIVLSAAKVG